MFMSMYGHIQLGWFQHLHGSRDVSFVESMRYHRAVAGVRLLLRFKTVNIARIDIWRCP